MSARAEMHSEAERRAYWLAQRRKWRARPCGCPTCGFDHAGFDRNGRSLPAPIYCGARA